MNENKPVLTLLFIPCFCLDFIHEKLNKACIVWSRQSHFTFPIFIFYSFTASISLSLLFYPEGFLFSYIDERLQKTIKAQFKFKCLCVREKVSCCILINKGYKRMWFTFISQRQSRRWGFKRGQYSLSALWVKRRRINCWIEKYYYLFVLAQHLQCLKKLIACFHAYCVFFHKMDSI